jgi:hypothetical protein
LFRGNSSSRLRLHNQKLQSRADSCRGAIAPPAAPARDAAVEQPTDKLGQRENKVAAIAREDQPKPRPSEERKEEGAAGKNEQNSPMRRRLPRPPHRRPPPR